MRNTYRFAVAVGLCLASFHSAQPRQQDRPPQYARECVPSKKSGTPPPCDQTLCSFLDPVCRDPCTKLRYSGGRCQGAVSNTSCAEFTSVGPEELCRDCSCDNYWGGHCSADGGYYPSGSVQHADCSS